MQIRGEKATTDDEENEKRGKKKGSKEASRGVCGEYPTVVLVMNLRGQKVMRTVDVASFQSTAPTPAKAQHLSTGHVTPRRSG